MSKEVIVFNTKAAGEVIIFNNEPAPKEVIMFEPATA